MKQLAPFLIMIAILITIAVCITVITNYILKKKIINRGPIDDNSLRFLNKISRPGQEMLKWGLIVLFGGIGLVVIEFIPHEGDQSSLPYGVEAIFIAIGFLCYYMIVKNTKNKD